MTRIAPATMMGAVAVALASTTIVGCGNPTQSVSRCQSAPEETASAIQERLTADATLRHAKVVRPDRGGYAFVSAEIHLRSAAPRERGVIATWATRHLGSRSHFVAVDVHAREQSSWPHATFTVVADGAIESRACTGLSAGKTEAQVRCEHERATGEHAPPLDEDCAQR